MGAGVEAAGAAGCVAGTAVGWEAAFADGREAAVFACADRVCAVTAGGRRGEPAPSAGTNCRVGAAADGGVAAAATFSDTDRAWMGGGGGVGIAPLAEAEVPEPTAGVLLVGAGLYFRRRRRMR